MKSRSELKRNGVIASMDVWRTYGETIEEMAAAVCYPNEIDPIVMGEIILGGDAVEVTATVLKIDEQRVKNLVANMLDPLWSKVYKRLIFPLEIAYADSDEEPEEKDDYNYLMFDPFSGYYKIGRSVNPEDRVKSINGNLPHGHTKVELVTFFWTEKSTDSEAYLHDMFEDTRQSGEWFELTQEDVEYFEGIESYVDGRFIMYEDIKFQE